MSMRLSNYFHLRSKGFSISKSITANPISRTETNILTLAMIISLVASFSVYVKLQQINSENMHRKAAFERLQAIKYKNQYQFSEAVLISALNGSYRENGKIVTLCRLNAAGECL